MKKKNYIYKFLTGILCASVLVGNALPVTVKAQGINESEAIIDSNVLYDADRSYSVIIPKTIVLGENKTSEYKVKVEGNILSNQRIYVSPMDSIADTSDVDFYMMDQSVKNPKEDVVAIVTQNKCCWEYEDVLTGYEEANNSVSAMELSAGTWRGVFEFAISIDTDIALDTDGDIVIEVGSQIQTNAYLNGKNVSNIVSWESSNEDIIITDGLISLTPNASAGDTAEVSVIYIDNTTGKKATASFKVTVTENIYGNVIEKSGYCGADETYEEAHFSYPTTVTNGKILNGNGDTCYTNATYTYYSDTNTLVISGTGEIKAGRADVYTTGDYGGYSMSLPRTGYGELFNKAEHLVIEDGITNVPEYAFLNFSKLKDVRFSKDIKTIGTFAFQSNASLTEIYLPDSVVTIGEYPFTGCSQVASIRIGTDVKNMGKLGNMENCKTIYYDAIAAECTNTGTLDYLAPAVDLYIGSEVVKIPDGFSASNLPYDKVNWEKIIFNYNGSLKEIGASAFSGKNQIKSLNLPDGVETIGENAFGNCTQLISIYIPASVTSISDAFTSCIASPIYCASDGPQEGWSNTWNYIDDSAQKPVLYNVSREEYESLYDAELTDIVIPDYMTEIREYAFAYHTITNIDMNNVISIGDYAFSNCKMESIKLTNSVCSIGEYAFKGSTLKNIELNDNITEIGAHAFESCRISTIDLPDVITEIKECTFMNCMGLKNIRIPDNVTDISAGAFFGCKNLRTIYIPNSVETIAGATKSWLPFYDASTLLVCCQTSKEPTGWGTYWDNYSTGSDKVKVLYNVAQNDYEIYKGWREAQNVSVSNDITQIPDSLFYGCKEMKSIYIPKSVQRISAASTEKSPFLKCNSSLKIYCEASAKESGWETYWNYYSSSGKLNVTFNFSNDEFDYYGVENVIIPDNITVITSAEMAKYFNMKTVFISKGVTKIAAGAFKNKEIEKIIFEEGSQLTTIEKEAFSNCKSLVNIEVPNSVTSIGSKAFQNCSSLNYVMFENESQLSNISNSMFYGCKSLTEIEIPDTVTNIEAYAFYNCTGLAKLTVPVHATFAQLSFDGCTNIEEIHLSSGTKSMINYTGTTIKNTPWYISASSVKRVVIEDGVTNIGNCAFYGCTALTDIVIPDSLTNIGSSAFGKCTSLTKLFVPQNVATISAAGYSSSPFYTCSGSLTIYCAASEKQDGWGDYWNYYGSPASTNPLNVVFEMTREQYESLFIDTMSVLSDETITNRDDVLIEINDISEDSFESQNEESEDADVVSEGTDVLIEFEPEPEENAINERTDCELQEESDVYTE